MCVWRAAEPCAACEPPERQARGPAPMGRRGHLPCASPAQARALPVGVCVCVGPCRVAPCCTACPHLVAMASRLARGSLCQSSCRARLQRADACATAQPRSASPPPPPRRCHSWRRGFQAHTFRCNQLKTRTCEAHCDARAPLRCTAVHGLFCLRGDHGDVKVRRIIVSYSGVDTSAGACRSPQDKLMCCHRRQQPRSWCRARPPCPLRRPIPSQEG